MSASELLCFEWVNHNSAFLHRLKTVKSQDLYSDATLACGGRFYPIHKLVLSACSEFFEQIFERTQGKHPVIVLTNIRAQDLDALLSYMYIGEVSILQDDLGGLIKAAECLRIKGLAVPDEDTESMMAGMTTAVHTTTSSPVSATDIRTKRSGGSVEESRDVKRQRINREVERVGQLPALAVPLKETEPLSQPENIPGLSSDDFEGFPDFPSASSELPHPPPEEDPSLDCIDVKEEELSEAKLELCEQEAHEAGLDIYFFRSSSHCFPHPAAQKEPLPGSPTTTATSGEPLLITAESTPQHHSSEPLPGSPTTTATSGEPLLISAESTPQHHSSEALHTKEPLPGSPTPAATNGEPSFIAAESTPLHHSSEALHTEEPLPGSPTTAATNGKPSLLAAESTPKHHFSDPRS